MTSLGIGANGAEIVSNPGGKGNELSFPRGNGGNPWSFPGVINGEGGSEDTYEGKVKGKS